MVAIAAVGGPARPRTPGLTDDAFETDGQLTKRHVGPSPSPPSGRSPASCCGCGRGQRLDRHRVAGAEHTAGAVAIEPRADRAERIGRNALELGVPDLRVVCQRAPEGLRGLPTPDAIFIGGGVTAPGLLDACWAALRPGGRLVANTVTLEGERAVAAARQEHGGALHRIDIAHAEPVGAFTGWRAQMTVVQWSVTKGA